MEATTEQAICEWLELGYYKGYGDPKETFGDDGVAVPFDGKWLSLGSALRPAKLIIRNKSGVSELYITWNNQNPKGYPIETNGVLILDNIIGEVFVKAVTAAVTIAFLFIPVKMNE